MGKPLKSIRVLDAFLECNNITSYSNEISGDGLSMDLFCQIWNLGNNFAFAFLWMKNAG